MDPQETRIYTIVLIICFTIGTTIICFFISVIRQQKRYLELQKKMMLTELNAIEKERARVARDLHDQINPVLAVVRFYIDSVEAVNSEDSEHLTVASGYVDDIINSLREISNDLMPSTLLGKGLIAATKEFIERAQESSGIKIDFSFDSDLVLPQLVSVNVFRILQEIIHNCNKHAKASLLQINISDNNGFLQIDAKDNGSGFDYKKALQDSSGFGLTSLKNRVEVMEGTMIVESRQGRGTAFQFKIPYK